MTLLLGRGLSGVRRRLLPLLCALVLQGCASAPGLVAPPAESRAVPDTQTEHSPLGRLAQQQGVAASGRAGDSALHLLPQGLASLAARRALIDRAERSIDVQYYIWRADTSGAGLAAALWQAAERGVRVRLLLDDWGARPGEEELGQLAAHPNIEVRLFNPLALRWSLSLALLLDFERGNRRMHNKALIVDNQALIVGGRNIGDEYFERRAELEFGDLDLLALGPVVRQASDGFDSYWNSGELMRVAPVAPRLAPPAEPLQALWQAARATGFEAALQAGSLRFERGQALALQDPPGKVRAVDEAPQDHLGHRMAHVMGEVRQELLLVSPYFVPGTGGMEQLRELRARGVSVRIVTNSLAATDVPAVHAGYARYRRELLRLGVELYEIRPDGKPQRSPGQGPQRVGSSRLSLHAKVLLVDRRSAFIGSMNIDPRSLRLNTENGVVVQSPRLAEALTSGVEQALLQQAYRVRLEGGALRWQGRDGEPALDHEPGASLWLRLQMGLFSLLPLEPLL